MRSIQFSCAGGCGASKAFRPKTLPFASNGCGKCSGWLTLRTRRPRKGFVTEIVIGIGGQWESLRQRLATKFEDAGSRVVHSSPYRPMTMAQLVSEEAELAKLQALLQEERERSAEDAARTAIEKAHNKLLRRHMPKMVEQSAKQTMGASRSEERRYISVAGLKARDWTPGTIKTFLGEPDRLATNPHYATAAKMRLYERCRVEDVEKTPSWLDAKEKILKRRQDKSPLTRSANDVP
jgi:hypothetical protein